jgi:nitrite reductase/ring-hydroxylating ferredoxin subunit
MRKLCSLPDLVSAKTKGFEFEIDNQLLSILVVHKEGEVYGYRNVCPHVGVSLNWVADRFLDADEEFLQCATHGALFRIEDGYCEYGPCAGDTLQEEAVKVVGEDVFWCAAAAE